ncbi:unnamed protein product [Rotaria sp. Silwood1]|nr:unnamed protein product [Rotaria sp. Silwood1]
MNSTVFLFEFYSRPDTTINYILRFNENDYIANGWIKSDADVISLTQSSFDNESSPKQYDRSWSTNSTRIPTIFSFYSVIW